MAVAAASRAVVLAILRTVLLGLVLATAAFRSVGIEGESHDALTQGEQADELNRERQHQQAQQAEQASAPAQDCQRASPIHGVKSRPAANLGQPGGRQHSGKADGPSLRTLKTGVVDALKSACPSTFVQLRYPRDVNYAGLKHQFDVARLWQGHGGPGHFPDLDMLPLGRISLRGPRGPAREARYSPDERRTLLTLWAMFQSPLMLGGELSSLSPDLVELLTNREVLEVDQRGRRGAELWRDGDHVAWSAELPDSEELAVALFNLGDQHCEITLPEPLFRLSRR